MVHAVKAFALDWLSDPNLGMEDRTGLLTEAEQEVIAAIQLDNQNDLALAYYAEILVDQQKWIQAEQNISQALERAPESDGCPPHQRLCPGIIGQLHPGDC